MREKCYKCAYCGKEMSDDLEVFCVLSDKPPSENVCWCVCNGCREEFIRKSRKKRSRAWEEEK